ncbi:hypothetical protein CDAR_177541 [Caerostris darwini]|uniref:Uncharacterized protein n=1 Tax=Caerostris darwini TaxID=1538125 RepID=A0AAV4P5D4_9ARAC|nr:hypothetical protein CDAR_177541 [Caerostris darwini]
MLSVVQFKTFLPQNTTVRLGSSFCFSEWDPSSKILSSIITSRPLSDKPEKKEREALMESFRSEENHQSTEDAFLITLFDMRNQSGRVVSPLLSNKGKKRQPPCKSGKGCNLDVQTIILDGSILDAPHYGFQEPKRGSKRMPSAKCYSSVKIWQRKGGIMLEPKIDTTFAELQFKTFLPQNRVRLGSSFSFSVWDPSSQIISSIITSHPLSDKPEERKALMESFRREENHQSTKDAFLITLFDTRNQSGRCNSKPFYHRIQLGSVLPSLSQYGFPRAKSYRPSLPLTLLVTSQKKQKRKALMESFRSEENHPFTKDAFLITLFDMRNQSGRVVSPLLNNKGKKKQPPSKSGKGCKLDVDVQTIILDGSILDAPYYSFQEPKQSSK